MIDCEREAAADRAAIASLSDEPELKKRVLVYADTLLAVAKHPGSFAGQATNRPIIGLKTSQSKLEDRICRLLSLSQTTPLRVASAVATFMIDMSVAWFVPVAAVSGQPLDLNDDIAIVPGNLIGEILPDRSDTIATTEIALTQKMVTRSMPAGISRPVAVKQGSLVSGGQKVNFVGLGELRGELSPLKTEMKKLRDLDPLR